MKLIAEFPNAQFWHGDSLDATLAEQLREHNVLAVTDPPAALAPRFWIALQGVTDFLVFAGLRQDPAIIAEKILTCQYFLHTELGRNETLCLDAYESFLDGPQYAITSNAEENCCIDLQDQNILEEGCSDCLSPSFVQGCIENVWPLGRIPYDCTIFDPFCGNGSTAVAASNLDLDFIGIDADKERVLIAADKYARSLVV